MIVALPAWMPLSKVMAPAKRQHDGYHRAYIVHGTFTLYVHDIMYVYAICSGLGCLSMSMH